MGHLVESAVGSYLLALANERRSDVHWWREGTDEVDFVISQADDVVAIEVKNGCVKSLKGLAAFVNRFPARASSSWDRPSARWNGSSQARCRCSGKRRRPQPSVLRFSENSRLIFRESARYNAQGSTIE